MKWLLAISVICCIFLLVTVLGSLYLFCYAVVRKEKKPDYGKREKYFIRLNRERYLPKFREGLEWLALHGKEAEDCYVESVDGWKLHGELYLSKDPNPKGVLILCHGFRSFSHMDFASAMPFYAKEGYHLLLISQRTRSPSEGKFISFGIMERFDVKHWARYIENRFPTLPIVFLGLSMGASTVLMAAELKGISKNLIGVIADCGFEDPKEEILHVLNDRMHLPSFPFYYLANLLCKLFCHFSFENHSIISEIQNIQVPVLWIHGESDRFVPTSFSRKMYDAFSGTKELLLIPHAVHAVSYLEDPEKVEKHIEAFLLKCRNISKENNKKEQQ